MAAWSIWPEGRRSWPGDADAAPGVQGDGSYDWLALNGASALNAGGGSLSRPPLDGLPILDGHPPDGDHRRNDHRRPNVRRRFESRNSGDRTRTGDKGWSRPSLLYSQVRTPEGKETCLKWTALGEPSRVIPRLGLSKR